MDCVYLVMFHSRVNLIALFIASVFLACTVVLTLHPLCNAIFQCGCEPIWAGGIDHCNIHQTQPPHCPWCTENFNLYLAVMLAPALLALAITAKRKQGLPSMLLYSHLSYLIGALIAGLLGSILQT